MSKCVRNSSVFYEGRKERMHTAGRAGTSSWARCSKQADAKDLYMVDVRCKSIRQGGAWRAWRACPLLFSLSLATQFPLPFAVQPEGITFTRGSIYFAADFCSGSIFLVDFPSGLISTAVARILGRCGVGIKASKDRLFVARGGAFGPGVESAMYIYDITTSEHIAACPT